MASSPPRFTIGETYRRRSLHEAYGGGWQGGISSSRSYPIIFLFTGESGHQYGYHDGRQEETGTYLYTGEGQVGSMQFIRGNRAIAEHQQKGKELHLFETTRRGYVQYVGPARYLGHTLRTAPDRDGMLREAIVFELEIEDELAGAPVVLPNNNLVPKKLWTRSLADLRMLALQTPPSNSTPEERKRNVYHRSEAVKVYVLRRSGGICEGCGLAAPFKRADGSYYLEPHHIRRMADSGPDHPRWVAALCPNCHRRVHYGEDGSSFNKWLADRIGEVEGEPQRALPNASL